MIDNINLPPVAIPMQYHNFGPFEIPQRKQWLIVGSGPTADLMPRFIQSNQGIGVISLNAQLGSIPISTVHIVGHYEYFLQCIHALNVPEMLFFSDPMEVGWRCQPIQAINLLDFNYYADVMGERLRFFQKEKDVEELKFRPNALYCRDSIGSAALHLLAKNGVKETFFCGIDGQEMSDQLGRAKLFEDAYKVRIPNSRLPKSYANRLDQERRAFKDMANHFGIRLLDMAESMAGQLAGV